MAGFNSDRFPAGLRVLVVDDDPICLLIVERLLRSCLYQVTTCGQALIALSLLREDSSRFDVVLSDVHMPDMDGFKLLELVRLEMDVPVIMMSANGETSNVMKGISQGACDYLLKPVRLEELQNIWQHVVRKKRKTLKESDSLTDPKDSQKLRQIQSNGKVENVCSDEATAACSSQRKRKCSLGEDSGNEEEDHLAAMKRQRVVWSEELHQKFIAAINHLGLEQAVPKRILDLMNVPGLTRENVASHLQKYRLYLKRMSGSVNTQFNITPCIGPHGRFMHSFTFMKGLPVSQSIAQFSGNDISTSGMCSGYSTDNDILAVVKPGGDPHVEYNRSSMAQYLSPTLQGQYGGTISPKHLKTAVPLSSAQPINLPQQSSEIVLLQRSLGVPNSRNMVLSSMPGSNQLLCSGNDHLLIHQHPTAAEIYALKYDDSQLS